MTLDPNDAQAHATLGDFLIESERLVDAERELRRAAELGGSYATRNGIVFEGKLYIKETSREWREGMGRGQQRETGYLLAVDAASGRVLERHHPPGIRQLSLGVRDGVLRLTYAAPQPVTATFANGRFEKPVFGSDLLTRRRGIDAGRLLAMNFLDKDDRWRSQPDPKTVPWAPATLPDLEARLRAAWWLLVGLLWVSRPSTPLPRRLAGDPGDRRILLVACLLWLSSFGYVVAVRGRVRALESMPVVVMDSLGSAENVFFLERRLAALDAVNLRVATAIANHMAGNLDRARELYQRLSDEPRVSRNRSALMNGEPAPPDARTHEDLVLAYEGASWSDWLQIAAELQGIRPLAAALVLDLGLLLGLVSVVAFGARIAVPQAIAWNESRRAIPGSADLARGRPLRTYVTLAFISFAFVVASTQVALRSSMPSMGVESALYQTSLKAFPLPFPPGTSLSTDEAFERGLRIFYWDFLRARPAVPLVWALAFLGGVTAVALHLAALRDLRLAAEPAAGAEPPGTACTEPALIDSAETSAKPPAKRSA